MMIEVVYKENSTETEDCAGSFQLPRNIRQIGFGGGKYRIYVEDYVYTFMNRLSEKSEKEQGSLAVLLGKTEWHEGNVYVFIKGAVYLEEKASSEHISLDNESWSKVQEMCRQYFKDFDVVGWFFAAAQLPMEVTEVLARNHLKYFAGGDKVLMLMEPQEKEEAFFYYENGRFVKIPGYYLYYEKNKEMQDYLIDHKWWEVSEKENIVPDEAVKNIRKIFAKKAEKAEKAEEAEDSKERTSVFSYAATACLVIAILVTGASFINNYRQIQNEEQTEASVVFTVDDKPISVTPLAALETSGGDKEKLGNDETEADKIKEEEDKETADIEATDTEATDTEAADTETEDTEAAEKEKTVSSNPLETYMIRPGDTLYQISILNYGTMDAITDICRINNISEEENIYPGQIIVLP